MYAAIIIICVFVVPWVTSIGIIIMAYLNMRNSERDNDFRILILALIALVNTGIYCALTLVYIFSIGYSG